MMRHKKRTTKTKQDLAAISNQLKNKFGEIKPTNENQFLSAKLDMHGYLEKKNRKNVWQRRWFIVHKSLDVKDNTWKLTLSWYKTHTSGAIQKKVFLENVQEVVLVTPLPVHKAADGFSFVLEKDEAFANFAKQQYVFKIVAGNFSKDYVIRGHSMTETMTWVNGLLKAVRKAKEDHTLKGVLDGSDEIDIYCHSDKESVISDIHVDGGESEREVRQLIVKSYSMLEKYEKTKLRDSNNTIYLDEQEQAIHDTFHKAINLAQEIQSELLEARALRGLAISYRVSPLYRDGAPILFEVAGNLFHNLDQRSEYEACVIEAVLEYEELGRKEAALDFLENQIRKDDGHSELI
uniref:PH domain-containing protein n=1 Tax=Aplanochytrium stocchinoi TaxID=215587 RepID=A0A7S3PL96_9STRA|mmetsp:Transcript_11768/g.15313  ORF Transcript_11768/g.15313 Transcript_11768/m.15313 type:complete len:349 (-) Transcript_11768:551-1597(-)